MFIGPHGEHVRVARQNRRFQACIDNTTGAAQAEKQGIRAAVDCDILGVVGIDGDVRREIASRVVRAEESADAR